MSVFVVVVVVVVVFLQISASPELKMHNRKEFGLTRIMTLLSKKKKVKKKKKRWEQRTQ